MYQVLIGIILVLGGGSFWLYNENQTLSSNNVSNLARKNAQIEADKDKYLSILSKHNFEKLAIAKPGLMEIRFNKGTEEVIKEIENDTKIISDLGNDSSD